MCPLDLVGRRRHVFLVTVWVRRPRMKQRQCNLKKKSIHTDDLVSVITISTSSTSTSSGMLIATFLFWFYLRRKSSHLVTRTSSPMDERKMLPPSPVAQRSSKHKIPPPSIGSSTQPVSQPAPHNPFVSIISFFHR